MSKLQQWFYDQAMREPDMKTPAAKTWARKKADSFVREAMSNDAMFFCDDVNDGCIEVVSERIAKTEAAFLEADKNGYERGRKDLAAEKRRAAAVIEAARDNSISDAGFRMVALSLLDPQKVTAKDIAWAEKLLADSGGEKEEKRG